MAEKEYIEREALIRYTEKQKVIIKDGTSIAEAMRIQGNVFRGCVETCPTADVVSKSEVERLTVEFEAMRTAANSYKMHYENAKTEVALEIFEEIETIVDNNTYKSYLPNSSLWSKAYKTTQIITELAKLKKK